MENDPYFINPRGSAISMKKRSRMSQRETQLINWAAPYLDGCKNCARMCGEEEVIDRYDCCDGQWYRCELFEFKQKYLNVIDHGTEAMS